MTVYTHNAYTPHKIKPPLPLTQLSACDGEILIQNGPLLNALGIGGGLLIDSVDSLLNSSVDGPVSAARDVGDSCGVATQPTAELNGIWCQLILWVACLCVNLTLKRKNIVYY